MQAALFSNYLDKDPTISWRFSEADKASKAAVVAAAAAAQAASDLAVASTVAIVGVVNGSRTICAAATSCTKAEFLALGLNAAITAQKAVDATNFAILTSNALIAAILAERPTFAIAAFQASITTATTESVKAQAAADQAEADYNKAAASLGATGVTIAATTGTTGTTGAAGTSGATGSTGTR